MFSVRLSCTVARLGSGRSGCGERGGGAVVSGRRWWWRCAGTVGCLPSVWSKWGWCRGGVRCSGWWWWWRDAGRWWWRCG